MASIPTHDERLTFESQIRECFGRCAYTHKTHEQMADLFGARLWRTKWTQIVCSALTTGGAVGTLFDRSNLLFPYATAALSLASLVVNSYAKDLDPGASAQRHRETASDIWDVREAYLSLLTDVRDGRVDLDDHRRRRDELQSRLHDIYRAAPHTDSKAYGMAQDRLQNREDLTFSDAEIDHLLPGCLKRALADESGRVVREG